LAVNRLKRLCREAGVARVDAGPQAIALTFKDRDEHDPGIRDATGGDERLAWRNGRLVAAMPTGRVEERLEAIETVLTPFRR
jgi:transcription-repair coupling factor (superfamily II helicase)